MTDATMILIGVCIIQFILLIMGLIFWEPKDCNKDPYIKPSTKESYCGCNCKGLDDQYFVDKQELSKLYAEGKLTEYTIPSNGHHSKKPLMPYDVFETEPKDPNNYNSLYLQKYDML